MKKTTILIVLLLIQFVVKAQNIPFTIGEVSSFKAITALGSQPCNTPFKCEYIIDEKNSDWTGITTKQKAEILNSSSFLINHMPEFTECKLVAGIKRLTTYTENTTGESILIYFGDTVAYKTAFNLQRANSSGQDITSEICNQAKYDYEGFNCFCNRFIGKSARHPEPCMATTNFPAVNTIFNLYYGFDQARYFPVTFNLSINGRKISFILKNISFETIPQVQMPTLDEYEICKELEIQEFLLKTPELH